MDLDSTRTQDKYLPACGARVTAVVGHVWVLRVAAAAVGVLQSSRCNWNAADLLLFCLLDLVAVLKLLTLALQRATQDTFSFTTNIKLIMSAFHMGSYINPRTPFPF